MAATSTWTARTPARLGTATRFDAVSYLTFWLALLAGINARQVIGVFGAVGSPALLVGAVALTLWMAGWVLPTSGLDRSRNPLRLPLLVYFWAMCASYAVTLSRPLTDLEASGATRGLVVTASLVGVGLLVADGVQSRERLETLLRRLVVAIAFVSFTGILQFAFGRAFQFEVPGLVLNSEVALAVGGRSIFNRPAGTTLHPIEYSVVTAAALPLALYFALEARTLATRRNFGIVTGIVALGAPLSISRSGLLALVVGLAVAALGWSWRRRFSALLVSLGAVPLLWMVIPGLVGTLLSLFRGVEYDPSIQARIDRRPRIMALISERPWFGLGNGTWSVEDYFLIDNEIYVTTLETGIVGLLLTGALFGFAVLVAVTVRYLPGADRSAAQLGHAIGASLLAIVISFATFDAFHYRILTGMLFVLIGAAGALWRLTSGSAAGASSQGPVESHDAAT